MSLYYSCLERLSITHFLNNNNNNNNGALWLISLNRDTQLNSQGLPRLKSLQNTYILTILHDHQYLYLSYLQSESITLPFQPYSTTAFYSTVVLPSLPHTGPYFTTTGLGSGFLFWQEDSILAPIASKYLNWWCVSGSSSDAQSLHLSAILWLPKSFHILSLSLSICLSLSLSLVSLSPAPSVGLCLSASLFLLVYFLLIIGIIHALQNKQIIWRYIKQKRKGPLVRGLIPKVSHC